MPYLCLSKTLYVHGLLNDERTVFAEMCGANIVYPTLTNPKIENIFVILNCQVWTGTDVVALFQIHGFGPETFSSMNQHLNKVLAEWQTQVWNYWTVQCLNPTFYQPPNSFFKWTISSLFLLFLVYSFTKTISEQLNVENDPSSIWCGNLNSWHLSQVPFLCCFLEWCTYFSSVFHF